MFWWDQVGEGFGCQEEAGSREQGAGSRVVGGTVIFFFLFLELGNTPYRTSHFVRS